MSSFLLYHLLQEAFLEFIGTVTEFAMFIFCWEQGSGNSHDVSPVARGSLITLDAKKTGSADHAEVKQGQTLVHKTTKLWPRVSQTGC